MSTIIKVILLTLLVILITNLVPGVSVDSIWPTAVVAGIVIAFLNSFIKPLAQAIALPITFLTFGLFSFVINAILFWATGPILGWVGGLIGVTMVFVVSTWFAAFVGGLIAALGVWVINQLFEE